MVTSFATVASSPADRSARSSSPMTTTVLSMNSGGVGEGRIAQTLHCVFLFTRHVHAHLAGAGGDDHSPGFHVRAALGGYDKAIILLFNLLNRLDVAGKIQVFQLVAELVDDLQPLMTW